MRNIYSAVQTFGGSKMFFMFMKEVSHVHPNIIYYYKLKITVFSFNTFKKCYLFMWWQKLIFRNNYYFSVHQSVLLTPNFWTVVYIIRNVTDLTHLFLFNSMEICHIMKVKWIALITWILLSVLLLALSWCFLMFFSTCCIYSRTVTPASWGQPGQVILKRCWSSSRADRTFPRATR